MSEMKCMIYRAEREPRESGIPLLEKKRREILRQKEEDTYTVHLEPDIWGGYKPDSPDPKHEHEMNIERLERKRQELLRNKKEGSQE